ncbi:MAG: DUF2344 domain-containing protein [Oscillospiraceae bacterium]|nr:DUF2344 domain-containing protein [Oscillospiraceae bacterium]
MFIDYRVCYTKTGRLKYISHLDVNRLMQRALKRSGLPVWYSEGFNPHIYLTFALPLALGLESHYEIMDFRLTAELPEKEIIRRLQSSLPDGMTVLSVSKPLYKAQDIGRAGFRLELYSERPEELAQAWSRFLEQKEILVEKKTKKGVRTIDIKPDIHIKCVKQAEDVLTVDLLLPAGIEKNISPFLVLEAFEREQPSLVEDTKLFKIDVLTKEGEHFR